MVDMANNLLSLTEFADKAGVSRQNVSKLVKNGALVRRPGKNGKIDINHPVNDGYLKLKKGTQEKKAKKKTAPASKKTVKSKKKKANKKTTKDNEDETEENDPGSFPEDLKDCTIYQLKKIKEIEAIEKIRLGNQILRETLVKRNLVTTIFSKVYEIHMNEFLTIKDKLIPDIAAVYENKDSLKNIAAGEKMDDELWKTLNHIKQLINKYLEALKAEEI